MSYHQITTDERYTISALRKQGFSACEIARHLNRSPSTITREIKRNLTEGTYRPKYADQHARARRVRSRRKWHFSDLQWQMVIALIKLDWSPEQVSGWLRKNQVLSISHETIYRYIWYNKFYGGKLYRHLRQAGKIRRKRYNAYDSRGILTNKRHISERPLGAENKSRVGHWEIDTVMGAREDTHCVVTLVDRKTKYTLIGKIPDRSVKSLNSKVQQMILNSPHPFRTITADNGTEFHGFKKIEQVTGTKFFFATPHHSWERGLNENTNGLIRQYLPKRKTMKHITQKDCDEIATRLNRRPRKTLNFNTPEKIYKNSASVALRS